MSDESNLESEQTPGRRYIARPKICQFCADKNVVIDYKLVDLLRRYVSDDGKIRPRRQTGTCAKHQRELARAIKNARHIALLPFTAEPWSDSR
jgi:small subunit ribosomal protein S18